MSLRKVLGSVKDQTSIGIAKVSSNIAPELEVAIVKATSHDDDPANEKYIREILHLTSFSRMYISACIVNVARRLTKTRDWIVALKALTLVHRLLLDGDPEFQNEILYATRRGTRLLNMSDFKDEAHSNSWDHSAFVRTYALYLDQKLEFIVHEKKQGGGKGGDDDDRRESREERWRSPPPRIGSDYGDFREERPQRSRSYGDVNEAREEKRPVTPLVEMKPERILGRMNQLQRLFERFLTLRPTGAAKNCRMVLVALYPVVKESFKLYGDICEVLAVLLDKFFDMEYPDCVKSFEVYASAAKQIDELVGFYNWCKEVGVARSSEYPEVQRITDKLLETLEEFMRDRSKKPKTPERIMEPPPVVEDEPLQDMNEIKALPAPENWAPAPEPEPAPAPAPKPKQETGDLVDLREDPSLTVDHENKFALALFNGPATGNSNGSWEAFPSNGEPEVTSAWQTPAAETGKADWELALVETASNLSKQKAALGGGLDPLLLNGMYDQGIVRQHVSNAQLTGGSASSVALPTVGRGATPMLALPAPDGSGAVQAVGQDPFAASLMVPPPSYVQMADMEKKQSLVVQEQQMWQQYERQGMQGQSSLVKLNGGGPPGYYQQGMMPYGMPPPVNGMGQPGGYYYTTPY